MVKFGFFSIFELIYRASIIYANLREDSRGYLAKSAAFDELDPSEKGAMSYFFGLATAKLLAEKRLGVSWLMHLDVYRHMLHPVVTHRGKVKPDLLGRDTKNQWIVFEAKGRSGVMPSRVMDGAKAQTANLHSVAGVPITLGVAHGASFKKRRLNVDWVDPQPREDAARLSIEPEQFDENYYGPIELALASPDRRMRTRRLNDRLCEMVPAPELDLRIGRARSDQEVRSSYALTADSNEQISSEYVGGDGIAVQLGPSWSDTRMRLELTQREPIPLSQRVT